MHKQKYFQAKKKRCAIIFKHLEIEYVKALLDANSSGQDQAGDAGARHWNRKKR